MTKAAALEGTSDSGNNNTFLGKRNKDFTFADLKPFKIQFVEISARGAGENGTADLGALQQCLIKL